MTEKTSRSGWYYLIDGLRGFALLNMLLFHFFYDFYVVFGVNYRWYYNPAAKAWQQFICISFLLISGISWHFSKNNLKRGILLNLYGLAITAVTFIFVPSQTVWFGILNGIGCCTLIMIPLHKLFQWLKNRFTSHGRLLPLTGFIASLLLFLLTRHIDDGHLNVFGQAVYLPDWLYAFKPMTILGFPYTGFASGDYFPVLPWIFIFMTGYFIWDMICYSPHLLQIFRTKIPFLSRIGKNTIRIYLLHQPLLYLITYLLVNVIDVQ